MRMKLRILLILGMTLVSLTSLQGQSFLTNGLIGYWPLDGNANDVAGTNHGVVYGATLTTNRLGKPNSAYLFNGTTAYIQTVQPMRDLSNATFSLWFHTKSVAAQSTLLSDSTTASGNDWSCLVSPLGSYSGIAVGGSKVVGAGSVQVTNGFGKFLQPITNNWLHFVWVMQPTNQKIYVNGTLVANDNVKCSNVGYHNSGFVIGADCSMVPYFKFFNGILSDVRVYDRTLTPAEVYRMYLIESGVLSLGKSVYVEQGGLSVGGVYQLQYSSDLTGWTNCGNAFVATNSYWRPTNYWDVDQWGKLFFRLVPQ